MPKQLQANGSISITAMSLVEFLPLVVEALKDGYELDLDSNEGTPQQLGTLLVLTMFKLSTESKRVQEVVDEARKELTPTAETVPIQRGRPKLKQIAE